MNKKYNWSTGTWLRSLCLPLLACLFSYGAVGQLYYTFAGQTAGTYTAITGGTVLSTPGFDDNIYAVSGLPSFNYNGANYTACNVSSNGFITVGATAPTTTTYTALSSALAYNGAIAAFGRDQNGAAAGAPEVRYEVIGNEIIFQWQDVRRFNAAGERFSYQIRIDVVTNVINVVYGGTITGATTNNTAQVGLRGASNAFPSNINNRLVSTANTWATSTPGTLATSGCRFSTTAPATIFTAGQTYTWNYTPPSCLPPTAMSLFHTSPTSTNISWSSAPTVFIEWGPNGYTPGTLGTPGGAATGSILTSSSPFNITGLASGDDIYIRQECVPGVDYSANTLFDFLVGDECGSGADILCGGGPYTGNTTANTVGADPTGGTGCGAGGYVARSAWYHLAGDNSFVTLDLSASAYDTRITIMSGSCGALTCVAGDDDSGAGLTSLVQFNSLLGTDYYVIIHGFGAGSFGAYSMAITCLPLCVPLTFNDECAASEALVLNASETGNNECATASAQGPIGGGCGGLFSSYFDVWFNFTSSAFTTYELEISSVASAAPQSAGIFYYSLMTACGPGVTCTTFDPSVGVISPLTLTPATGYIVRVYTSSQDAGFFVLGNFEIEVREVTCASPTALTATNVGATSADLTWTQNSGASNYEIEFGPGGFIPTGVATHFGAYPTPYNMTGLTASTPYTYYVRDDCGLGDFSSWAGPYNFSTGLVNDACTDAITVSCPSNVSGTTVGSQSDLSQVPDDCSATGGGRTGVWYQYVGNDQAVTIDMCNAGTDFDTQISIFDGTCAALNCVAGNDDGAAGSPTCDIFAFAPFKSQVTWNAYLGTTYLIFIHGFSDFDEGLFQMDISCAVLCLPVPGNDECAAATTLTVGGTCVGTNGSTLCSNQGTYANPGCMDNFFGTYTDVWYNFVATDAGHDVRINLGTSTDIVVEFFFEPGVVLDCETDLASFGCLEWSGVDNPSGADIQITGMTIGETIWMRVLSETGAEGTFDICVWDNPCPFPINGIVGNATTSSFDFQWTETGTATVWDIYYVLDGGVAPVDFVTPPTLNDVTNPVTIGSLPAETCYDVWVRSDNPSVTCESVWTGPYAACTNALPPDCSLGTTLACAATTNLNLGAGNGAWNIGDDSFAPFSTPGKERVYKYTATGTGLHYIDVTASSNNGFVDYFWILQSAGCASTGWNYIDDFFGVGTSASFILNAGDQIYIAADRESTGGTVTQTFRVLCPTPAPVNDTPAGAQSVSLGGNGYPNCGVISGDLTNATDSPEETYASGKDVWYQFVAVSNGVRLTQSGLQDDVIHLFDSTLLTALDVEDAGFVVGDVEIMNFGGLTAGQTYFVCVDAWTGGSTFTLCMQQLLPSTCADGLGAYALCTNFKPTFTGANLYTFNFEPTSFAGPTSTGTSTSQIALTSLAPAIQYGASYDVTIDGTFDLLDGNGNLETIIVSSVVTCPVSIAAHPDAQVKLSQRCAATVLKNSIISAKPFVCGVLNWTVVATEVDACVAGNVIGLPITGTTVGSAASINLNQINVGGTIQGGGKWYSITWTPNFSYGPGTLGTAQVINVVGAVSPEEQIGQVEEERSAFDVEAALYPNPNAGNMVYLNLDNVESNDVYVNITDMNGRIVYTERFIVDGSLNTIVTFAKPLANGVYNVQFIMGDQVITERMSIQK